MGRRQSPLAKQYRQLVNLILNSQVDERSFDSDLLPFGYGTLRLRLRYMPSFVPGTQWEIRERYDCWRVYVSEIASGRGFIRGYTELKVESDILQARFDEVCALNLPIRPKLSNRGGCDGTSYSLLIRGDEESRFSSAGGKVHQLSGGSLARVLRN